MPTKTWSICSANRLSHLPKSAARYFIIAALFCLAGTVQAATNYIVGYWQGAGTPDVSHLTHLNYAFASLKALPSAPGSPTHYTCSLGGNEATLKSRFQSLKQTNSNLKILISIGGADATMAPLFTAASNDPNFAHNCVSQTLGLLDHSADGLDIDWEFPSPSDQQNFVNLMAALHSELSSSGGLLTAAVGNGPTNNGQPAQNANILFSRVLDSVNFFNVMTYDAYSSEATTFGAPLFASNLSGYGTYNGTVNDTIVDLLTTQHVPASKVVLGIPFYGIRYSSVPVRGINEGIFQTPAAGATTLAIPYNQIQVSPTGKKYCDTGSGAPAACPDPSAQSAVPTVSSQEAWIYDTNGPAVTTFDDPSTIAAKVKYARSQGLAGVMVWELMQDTSSSTLLNTIVNNMPAQPPTTPQTETTLFDFENGDSQGWARTGGLFSVYATNDKANTGTGSLLLSFITYRQYYQPNGTVWVTPPAAVKAGSTVSFRLWVPANAFQHLTAITPFFMDKNWSWTSSQVALSGLTANAWNTISVTVPANAVTNFTEIGIQFDMKDLWNGTLYLDTVTVR